MKTTIGAYEAKTRLRELLRQVRNGKRFTITNRGEAVAELIPPQRKPQRDKAAAVEKFRAFIREHPVRKAVNVRALIDKGRA